MNHPQRLIARIFASTLIVAVLALATNASAAEAKSKALIVTGQMNKYHDWKATTPVIKDILESTGLFTVDVAISPPEGPLDGFKPDFAAYDVLALNYDGAEWAEATKQAFVDYIKNGGGLIVYHSSDNAFKDWSEFNEIIGVGGWGGRDGSAGAMISWEDGKVVVDDSGNQCGSHGPQSPYQLVHRTTDHPITQGLPVKWMHTKDELYAHLRGPAVDKITILASAFSDPDNKGTGKNEPVLMIVEYGKGRIFHTTMGHAVSNMTCVGFITTLQRGAEWCATGKVTQSVPADFPSEDTPSTRTLMNLGGK
jgi:type 1 glutamine amidotransferase